LLAPAHGGSWPVLFCSFMSFDWVHLSTPRLGLCTNFGGPQIIAESCFLVPVCALGAGNSAALHFLLSFFFHGGVLLGLCWQMVLISALILIFLLLGLAVPGRTGPESLGTRLLMGSLWTTFWTQTFDTDGKQWRRYVGRETNGLPLYGVLWCGILVLTELVDLLPWC